MAQLSNLFLRLAKQLFPDRNHRDEFVSALMHPQSGDAYLLWCQPKQSVFEARSPLPWQPEFVDRIAPGQLPERHVLFGQGAYYAVDFNAVFAASVLLAVDDRPGIVLDLCAGSGGKSIFAWQLLQPKRLLSNTIIQKQRRFLLANLRRSGITPSAIMSVDSGILAEVVPAIAEVVIVDAPSSTQSVLARGKLNPGCFHPVTINKYAKRQRRLLASGARIVAPQGYLLYTTSTYSLEENERVLDWFLDRFPQFRPCEVPHLEAHRSTYTPHAAYRLFPHQVLPQEVWGAGGFTVLLQNTTPGTAQPLSPNFLNQSRVTLI